MSNILILTHLQQFHLTKEDIANKRAGYSIIFLDVNNFDNTSMQDATNIEEIIFWSLLFGLVNIEADTCTPQTCRHVFIIGTHLTQNFAPQSLMLLMEIILLS
jgi:hypothetical protein